MDIKIYIRSAGQDQGQDYSWQEIDKSSQKQVEERQLVANFKYLLQTEEYSILLELHDGKLILLITGMQSNRRDYLNRVIRNSVALILINKPENESLIRAIIAIAIFALKKENQENLSKIFDEAITKGGESGFEVSYQKINSFIEKDFGKDQTEDESSDKKPLYKLGKCYLGENSPKNRDSIAKELQKTTLSKVQGDSQALVVVTGIKSEDDLIKAKVWLGLSTLIKGDLSERNIEKNWIHQLISSNGRSSAIALFLGLGLGLGLLFMYGDFRGAIFSGNPLFVMVEISNDLSNKNSLNSRSFPLANNNPGSIAISADGNKIVIGTNEGKVQVLDRSAKITTTKTPDYGQEKDASKVVSAVAISADGKTIVAGYDNGKLWSWSETADTKQSIYFDKFKILAVGVSNNGKIASSNYGDPQFNNVVYISDINKPHAEPDLVKLETNISALALSSDGKNMVTVDDKGKVQLWDLTSQPPKNNFSYKSESNSVAVTISSDGKTIVFGGEDGTVWMWNSDGNNQKQKLFSEKGKIEALSIKDDGKTIVAIEKKP